MEELENVLNEIRRCLNFFQDETETSLWIDDYNNNQAYIVDEDTGAKYKITIEKVN